MKIIIDLIHEIYHRIDNVTGHEIFKDNEKALIGHSEMMAQVLIDNKEFTKLFLEK